MAIHRLGAWRSLGCVLEETCVLGVPVLALKSESCESCVLCCQVILLGVVRLGRLWRH